jgi:hypothetical protein
MRSLEGLDFGVERKNYSSWVLSNYVIIVIIPIMLFIIYTETCRSRLVPKSIYVCQKCGWSLGVDFTKLFRQAKSCRRTVFGKKFEVQFHQQSSEVKIRSKFAKLWSPFAKRSLPILCVWKIRAQMVSGLRQLQTFLTFLR